MWKDCSCKINFICIYPGVGIRSQPKSNIINPLPGRKNKKVSICIQGFSCLPGFFLLFPSTCWCCQVPYSCSHFVCCWLVCWFSIYKVYPPSFLPSLLSSLSFLLCFSPVWRSTSWKVLSSAQRKVTLATSSASRNTVTKSFIQHYLFSVWGHIFLCAVSAELLSLRRVWGCYR